VAYNGALAGRSISDATVQNHYSRVREFEEQSFGKEKKRELSVTRLDEEKSGRRHSFQIALTQFCSATCGNHSSIAST
jgi:hypothetical protein